MDAVLSFLNTSVYGDVRVLDLVQGAMAFIVLRFLWRLMRPAQSATAGVTVPAGCGCGWRGQASRHAPKCPRCGNPAVLM